MIRSLLRAASSRSGLMAALALAALTAACDKPHGPISPGDANPPRAQQDQISGGGTVATVPARTGSMTSGVEGSTTVIGAPPKGQPGIAYGH